MRIYKYIHSCFLIEHEDEKLLFDPGNFSFVEGRVRPEIFGDVSTIVITHYHPDHVDVDYLRRILTLSNACVVANAEVACRLQEEGIGVILLEEGTRQTEIFTLQAIPARHEPILSDSLPLNTAFLVNERVLNPGDSLNESLFAFKGIELLILPITAPWLTEPAVADFARAIQPRQLLAAHDGYVKNFFLQRRYVAYRSYFEQSGIQFYGLPEPGACVEL